MLKSTGLIILTALCIISVNLNAQNKEEINKTDSISFALYNASKWESIINYFESSPAHVCSNYYFLMRRAIAYYSLENYVSAIDDFNAAAKLDPMQDSPKEYLYYCFLNLGRKSDADVVASGFNSKLKKKIKYNSSKFFSGIYTEHSYAFGSSLAPLPNPNPPPPYLYMIRSAPSGYLYNNISLFHSIGSRVSYFQSYNHFSYKTTKQYNIRFNPETKYNLTTSENDYYGWLSVNAGKGFTIGGVVHYFNIKEDDVNMRFTGPSQPVFTNVTSTTNDLIAGLSVVKYAGQFIIALNGNAGRLNYAKQVQAGVNLTFLPAGNLNLYISLNAQFCSRKPKDTTAANHFVFEPKIGVGLSKQIWAEAYYTAGDIYNYSEDNMFTVFNNLQKITQRFGLNLIIPVTYNKLELSLRYQYLNLQEENAYYFDPFNYEIKTTSQSINKITGGIKWTF